MGSGVRLGCCKLGTWLAWVVGFDWVAASLVHGERQPVVGHEEMQEKRAAVITKTFEDTLVKPAQHALPN